MRILALAALAATMLCGAAHADQLVVDRGLPTTNLNNAAGSNRSNTSWATGAPYFIGDTFTLGGTAGTTYEIDTIRTWVVARYGDPVSATLYTGLGADADLTAAGATPTFTLVNYADGTSYQATSGPARLLYQVDFTGLDIVADAGSTISFGVDGVNQGGYGFFNHASNAALSGSPQDSADNVMAYYYHDGSDAIYYADYDSDGNGFDKSTDINVQVFANVSPAAVPEPASWAMMMAGFGGMGATMRRRKAAIRYA